MKPQLEILLIEDNEGDVELVRAALEEETPPCRLSVINNGRRALDRLLKYGEFQQAPLPQLILLDLNLSGMDGKILLKLIKQDAQLKTIPIVILTSSRAPADILDTYAHYANCYIVKPFDGSAFKNAIKQAMSFWRDVVQLPPVAVPH